MSHTVTVRTATVTTSTSAIIINTGFMKTYRGALKLLELVNLFINNYKLIILILFFIKTIN